VKYLEHTDREDLDEYENLSHRELVEKIHELEERIDRLEQKFETFQRQVMNQIQ
jgi:predicted ATP-grasp superfamily ATP-dependent carboligase